MQHKASHQKNVDKLKSLIRGIRYAMLTTIDEDGSLRSRPMATQQVEFDGDLWFFTDESSLKVHELERNPQVNVAYSRPEDQHYVSVSGKARLMKNRRKMEELWNPMYRSWFPQGLDDPHITLIKVEVEKAEYWDTPNSKMVHLFGFLKAVATGKVYEPGLHESLNL